MIQAKCQQTPSFYRKCLRFDMAVVVEVVIVDDVVIVVRRWCL